MEKNRYPEISGGVDNHYKKRAVLTALLLSALFCWGNNVEAYEYNALGDITIDNIKKDKNDLLINNGTKLTCQNDITPQKETTTTEKVTENIQTTTLVVLGGCGFGGVESGAVMISGLPETTTKEEGLGINNVISTEATFEGIQKTLKDIYGYTVNIGYRLGSDNDPDPDKIIPHIRYEYGRLTMDGSTNWNKNMVYLTNNKMEEITRNKLITETTDAAIFLTIASSLIGQNNIKTAKEIHLDHDSSLMAAGSITGGSIDAAKRSIVKGTAITTAGELNATDASTISATSGNLSSNHITVSGGSTVSATGTITTTGISADNGKVKAGNLTANSLSIWNGSIVDISKGTLTINGGETWLDAHSGKIKAKFLKVKNTTGKTNSIGSDTHITGGLTLKGKAQTVSAGATNTDMINKAQMTTALNNVKLNLGKTYSAGSGINLSTNNAVGLTNATAYTTSDKKRISLVGAAKTDLKKVKAGKVSATSKDLINGSQLYAVQQSIAGFADRIQTNKNQLETLKSSINAKKAELSGIQKSLNTIKGTKLNQDMSNLTTDGEAVIKSQVKKAIQKFQKDMDVSTVQANVQEAKDSGVMKANPAENNEPSIMLANAPREATNEPVNAVSAISKEEVAAKADLSQTKANLEKKATLDTMNVSAYTKQLSKGLTTGESAYHALLKAKEDRLVQAKENTLNVGANSAETKIAASKKNWTGILVDEKEAGSMANVGYVNQTLSMESSYDKLSLMKKDLEKDTNKGIAKAAAMAALKPIGHDEEDKVSFAIGYGHYKDGNAAAIGTFFRPSQDILIHLDITAGAGKPSMNTGVSFKVGKGSSYASMTREELAAENTAMKNQAEKQAERIHMQKEKIKHLESVMQSIRF